MKINNINLEYKLSDDELNELSDIVLESGEGKELILHLMDNSFENPYKPSVESNIYKLMEIDGIKLIIIEILSELENQSDDFVFIPYVNFEFKTLKVIKQLK